MKKKLLALVLAGLLACVVAGCGGDSSSNPAPEETENEVVFDLDNYKNLVSDCRQTINDATIAIGNMGKYEVNYWKAHQNVSGGSPDQSATVEKAFDWLEENSDHTQDSVEAAYNKIREQYKEIILTDIEGAEAEEIDKDFRDMYEAYTDLYSLVTAPSGTLSSFTESINDYLNGVTSADEALSLFLD